MFFGQKRNTAQPSTAESLATPSPLPSVAEGSHVSNQPHRHKDPELFFAIVAPVGANVERVCDGLEEALKRFNYKLKTIRVIQQLSQFEGFLDHESGNFDEQLENRMNKGDDFRDLAERDDALAFLAVASVVRDRADKPVHRQGYLFRSLKRPEEVTALRRIYGSNLIVIGVHSAREQKVENLAERIAQSRFSAQRDHFRDKAEALILRDESDEEKEHTAHGLCESWVPRRGHSR